MWDKFRRHVIKVDTYEPTEVAMMKEVHRCFSETCGTEIPKELKFSDDGKTPCHQISPADLIKSCWADKLNRSLLTTEAGRMVGDITDYTRTRAGLGRLARGNPNDPWNLVCYELLIWLTRDLSGAKCDDATLAMVQARCQYINKLVDARVFPPKEDANKTMLGVLTSLRGTLQQTIIPIIQKEIAHSHVRQHLARLKMLGELILNYGFQFLYYVIRKTKEPPAVDITQLLPVILKSKSGLLLQCLIETTPYCNIFDLPNPAEKQPQDPVEQESPRKKPTFSNPFVDDTNQICIPASLVEGVQHCHTIPHYLHINARKQKIDNTGIFKPFREDHGLLSDYLEMHALLVELAKSFIACDEAYKCAGIGGDLLVYGTSNKLINDLMDTIKKLNQALAACHGRINSTAKRQQVLVTKTVTALLSRSEKYWLENFQELPSINTQLESALEECIAQANFVQKKSNETTVNTRITRAQQQTQYFAHTTTLLSAHVDDFLGRKPPQIPQHRGSLSLSPRLSTLAAASRTCSPTSPRTTSLYLPSGRRPTEESPLHSTSIPGLPLLLMSSHRTEELFTANSGAENGASIATAKSTPITKLQCPPAGISAQSMKFLHQLLEAEPELKKIKFSNNPHVFGTSNIEAVFNFSELLQQHRKLGTLEIQECGLDSQGACIIASKLPNLPLLKVLDASLNPLGDEGAEALCSALVSCPLFYDLRMAQCGLTNTGAGYILALLKENPQITDLTLTDNKISDHLIRQIEAQIAINRQKILDMQNPFLNNITSHSRMF